MDISDKNHEAKPSPERQSTVQARLADPLSKVTRNQRRNLLVSAGIGFTVARMGIVPEKISALGIEFSRTEQTTLLVIVAAVIFYFTVAFLLYGWSDFLSWRFSVIKAMRNEFQRKSPRDWHVSNAIVLLLRIAFDYVFPVVAGVGAILTIAYSIPKGTALF